MPHLLSASTRCRSDVARTKVDAGRQRTTERGRPRAVNADDVSSSGSERLPFRPTDENQTLRLWHRDNDNRKYSEPQSGTAESSSVRSLFGESATENRTRRSRGSPGLVVVPFVSEVRLREPSPQFPPRILRLPSHRQISRWLFLRFTTPTHDVTGPGVTLCYRRIPFKKCSSLLNNCSDVVIFAHYCITKTSLCSFPNLPVRRRSFTDRIRTSSLAVLAYYANSSAEHTQQHTGDRSAVIS